MYSPIFPSSTSLQITSTLPLLLPQVTFSPFRETKGSIGALCPVSNGFCLLLLPSYFLFSSVVSPEDTVLPGVYSLQHRFTHECSTSREVLAPSWVLHRLESLQGQSVFSTTECVLLWTWCYFCWFSNFFPPLSPCLLFSVLKYFHRGATRLAVGLSCLLWWVCHGAALAFSHGGRPVTPNY